jgi:hypothetical protein
MSTVGDKDLLRMWREVGGSFHGPHVEHGYMEEAKLLPFLRALAARAAADERERCAQVCLTIETELMAAAEKHRAARPYDEYELLRLESEAETVSIVKDRIRALADVPVGT